jgi:hypothetical protein
MEKLVDSILAIDGYWPYASGGLVDCHAQEMLAPTQRDQKIAKSDCPEQF